MPLWLVRVHGVAHDWVLIGWTLATFSRAAAVGGIVAGLFAAWVERRLLVAGTTLLAPLPLFALFQFEPGGPAYFVAAGLGGALVNASLPLKIVTAQELAPRAVASASGMLMGFAMGIAGLLYVGIGALQEAIGLVPAASVAYAGLMPAALLAFVTLSRRDVTANPDSARPTAVALAGLRWTCPHGYTASATRPSPGTLDDSAERPLAQDPGRSCYDATIVGGSALAPQHALAQASGQNEYGVCMSTTIRLRDG